MKRSFDVAIIGAGIGGLSIAHLFKGFSVALIDAKNNPENVSFHTLGSFLDVKRFGLSEKVIAAEESEVMFCSPHFHVKKYGKAYIINKKQLYKELLEKAKQQKVETFFGARIAIIHENENGVESIMDERGNEFLAKIFIDATGLSGLLSKRFGLQDKKLNIATGLEYNIAYYGKQERSYLLIGKLYQGGYGWLFPCGNKRAILGYGSFNPTAKKELKERLNKMLELSVFAGIVKKDNEKLEGGTVPTDIKTKFVYKNVVCLGDSVSQVNPLVGEGHRFIMEFALLAAAAIKKAIKRNDPEFLTEYEQQWKKKYLADYKRSKRGQKIADWISNHDALSDLGALYLASKKNKTFIKLLAGHVTWKNLLLP
ncbi:MAG: lycopene cyclase family protein [Candidatus Levyibacteriota bacterium]